MLRQLTSASISVKEMGCWVGRIRMSLSSWKQPRYSPAPTAIAAEGARVVAGVTASTVVGGRSPTPQHGGREDEGACSSASRAPVREQRLRPTFLRWSYNGRRQGSGSTFGVITCRMSHVAVKLLPAVHGLLLCFGGRPSANPAYARADLPTFTQQLSLLPGLYLLDPPDPLPTHPESNDTAGRDW